MWGNNSIGGLKRPSNAGNPRIGFPFTALGKSLPECIARSDAEGMEWGKRDNNMYSLKITVLTLSQERYILDSSATTAYGSRWNDMQLRSGRHPAISLWCIDCRRLIMN